MEKELDRVLEEIMSTPHVTGCVVADQQGLCLGARGAQVGSAGVLAALAELAGRLQPQLRAPAVCLETDRKQCLIQRHGNVTGAIFKEMP